MDPRTPTLTGAGAEQMADDAESYVTERELATQVLFGEDSDDTESYDDPEEYCDEDYSEFEDPFATWPDPEPDHPGPEVEMQCA